jgi:hypothetical protein
MATSSAKDPATTIVVIAPMPPKPPPLSTMQTLTKAISADETTISFKDRAPHNSLRVDRLRVCVKNMPPSDKVALDRVWGPVKHSTVILTACSGHPESGPSRPAAPGSTDRAGNDLRRPLPPNPVCSSPATGSAVSCFRIGNGAPIGKLRTS